MPVRASALLLAVATALVVGSTSAAQPDPSNQTPLAEAEAALARRDPLAAFDPARAALAQANGHADAQAIAELLAYARSACALYIDVYCGRGLERLDAAEGSAGRLTQAQRHELALLRAQDRFRKALVLWDELETDAWLDAQKQRIAKEQDAPQAATGTDAVLDRADRADLERLLREASGFIAEVERSPDPGQRLRALMVRTDLAFLTNRKTLDKAVSAAEAAIGRAGTVGAQFRYWLLMRKAIALERAEAPVDKRIVLLEQARAEAIRTLPAMHPDLAELDQMLANAYKEANRSRDAVRAAVRSIDYMRKVPFDALPLDPFVLAASLMFEVGDLDKGVAYALEPVRDLAKSKPPGNEDLGSSLKLLVDYHLTEAPAAALVKILEASLLGPQQIIAPNNPEYGYLLNRLAKAYSDMGQPAQAAKVLDAVRQSTEGGLASPVRALLDKSAGNATKAMAAELYDEGVRRSWAEHDPLGAVALVRRAVEIFEATGPLEDPKLSEKISVLADLMVRSGEIDEAGRMFEAYVTRLRAKPQRNHKDTILALQAYQSFLSQIKRSDEAEWQGRRIAEEWIEFYRAEAEVLIAKKGPADFEAQLAVHLYAQELAKAGHLERAVNYYTDALLVPLLRTNEDGVKASLEVANLARLLRDRKSQERAQLLDELSTAMIRQRGYSTGLCERGRDLMPRLFDATPCGTTAGSALAASKTVPPDRVSGADSELKATAHLAKLRAALAREESLVPRNASSESAILAELASALEQGGRKAEALAIYFDAIDRILSEGGLDNPMIGRLLDSARRIGPKDEVAALASERLIKIEEVALSKGPGAAVRAAQLRVHYQALFAPAPAATLPTAPLARIELLARSPAGLRGSQVAGERLATLYELLDAKPQPGTGGDVLAVLQPILEQQAAVLGAKHVETTRTALVVARFARAVGNDSTADRAIDVALQGDPQSSELSFAEQHALRDIAAARRDMVDARRKSVELSADLKRAATSGATRAQEEKLRSELHRAHLTAQQFDSAVDVAIDLSRRGFDERLQEPRYDLVENYADMTLSWCDGLLSTVSPYVLARGACNRAAWRLHKAALAAAVREVNERLVKITENTARRDERRSAAQRWEAFIDAAQKISVRLPAAESETIVTEALIASDYGRATLASEALEFRSNRPGEASVRMRAPNIASIRKTLDPDEAIVAYFVRTNGMTAWVVRRDGVWQYALPANAEQVRRLTRLFRTGLNPNGVSAANSPEVEVEAAHGLWQALLEPLTPRLAGTRTMYVVPHGFLTAVPYSALVTEAPAEARWNTASTWRPAWAVEKFATALVPSLRSFEVLGSEIRPASATQALLGIGAPLLAGEAGDTPSSVDAVYANGRVDVDKVRRLSPLPDARRELEAMARVAGLAKSKLLLEGEASKPRLARQAFADYRTVVFATHGLMPESSAGVFEPALVLTPPAVWAAEDDGLLTASDIAKLKLDADVVVLSACNTGVDDSLDEANGMSGLAGAFLGAGARSVVVSQWPVVSDVAPELTIPLVSGNSSTIPALRSAMLQLAKGDRAQWRHPLYWAPFVIVGLPERAKHTSQLAKQ